MIVQGACTGVQKCQRPEDTQFKESCSFTWGKAALHVYVFDLEVMLLVHSRS